MDIPKIEDTFSPKMRETIWKIIITPLTDKQRETFKTEVVKKGFQLPNEEFDQYGLRFDHEYLNQVGGGICMMPLEFMADYADVICKNGVDSQEQFIEKDIEEDEMAEDTFPQTNATALGNIAYVVLHTKNEKVKAKCLDFLRRYMNFFMDRTIKVLTNKFKNLPIN